MNNDKVVIDNEPTPVAKTVHSGKNTEDSYEGRKHEPDIDGPQQDSQETDEIYSDPRKEEDLPVGGVNVAELKANDLSKEGNPSKDR